MDVDQKARYAIYFTFAEDHPLYRKSSTWLGHCVYLGEAKDHCHRVSDEISPSLSDIRQVKNAAQYGFHATLKPPFRLQSGKNLSDLSKKLETFSENMQPFQCAPLKVASLGQFVALITSKHCEDLQQLASQCVMVFDEFRAPLNTAERKKRQQANLTDRQSQLLETWGYPYVLDEFRFHMTLTDRLPQKHVEDAVKRLSREFLDVLDQPFTIDRLCLFEQPKSGSLFNLIKTFPLGKARVKERLL